MHETNGPTRNRQEEEEEAKKSDSDSNSASNIQKSMDFICAEEVVQKIIYTDSFIGIQPV